MSKLDLDFLKKNIINQMPHLNANIKPLLFEYNSLFDKLNNSLPHSLARGSQMYQVRDAYMKASQLNLQALKQLTPNYDYINKITKITLPDLSALKVAADQQQKISFDFTSLIPDLSKFEAIYHQSISDISIEETSVTPQAQSSLSEILTTLVELSKQNEFTDEEEENIKATYDLLFSSPEFDEETTDKPNNTTVPVIKNEDVNNIKNFFDQNFPSYKETDFYFQVVLGAIITWILEFVKYAITNDFDPITTVWIIALLATRFPKSK